VQNVSFMQKQIRGGCLSLFIGFGIVSGIILIPWRIIDFTVGKDSMAPLAYKLVIIGLLVVSTLTSVAIWRGKGWGVGGYILSTTISWILGTIYYGFSNVSFALLALSTAILIILIYREQRIAIQ